MRYGAGVGGRAGLRVLSQTPKVISGTIVPIYRAGQSSPARKKRLFRIIAAVNHRSEA